MTATGRLPGEERQKRALHDGKGQKGGGNDDSEHENHKVSQQKKKEKQTKTPCFLYKCTNVGSEVANSESSDWSRRSRRRVSAMALPLVMLLAHHVMGTAAQPPRVM